VKAHEDFQNSISLRVENGRAFKEYLEEKRKILTTLDLEKLIFPTFSIDSASGWAPMDISMNEGSNTITTNASMDLDKSSDLAPNGRPAFREINTVITEKKEKFEAEKIEIKKETTAN
jgi:hypothetical protein